MSLIAPDGTLVSYSNSFDNNYELVPPGGGDGLLLYQTGTYKIAVSSQAFNEADNALGVAVTKLSPARSIWTESATPAIASQFDPGAPHGLEVGVKFRSERAGYITGLRFFKGSFNLGRHVGSLWTSTGVLLGRAIFTNETASGWQEVQFPTSIPVSANTTYVASYFSPSGYFAFDQGYFTAHSVDRPPLRALASGADGPNGVYTYQPGSFPNMGTASNYWVDVVFSTTALAPVAPGPAAQHIWPDPIIPQTANQYDPGALGGLELGMKFRTEQAGSITGMRFYKGISNSGTRVGKLWSSSGALLASATFTNETPSGWQEVMFSSPVNVDPNTTYVVSYHSSTGYFAFNQGYFDPYGVFSFPLRALANGVDGPNGVYRYGPSQFPNQGTTSNYWVDVIFSPAP